MAYELNDTLSPLSREERNKVNENWSRITIALNNIQNQVNLLAGGDLGDIIEEIRQAMEDLDAMMTEGEDLIDQMDTAMITVSGYIDTMEDYVPRMEDGVTDLEALLPVLTNLRDELTTLNNNATIAENGRVSAEGIRTTNENIRNANENIRQNNEVTRQATLEEMELLIDNFESYAYSNSVEYDFPNFVLYNGSTYMALQRVSGLAPTNDGTNWRLVAQRGVDGSGSVSSVNGIGPDLDGNVELVLDIINNLTSTRTDASLSANMGRQLNETKLNVSDKASTAEVNAGTNDSKYVTPLRLNELTGKKEDLNTTNKDNLVASTNEVNTKVNQSEYQTPTVNARQIQVTKPSALNRIFFKLTTELVEGADITVSTDSGATSKPLVDIDENAVTSLDKGFHEIVESASFFTLRNKGGGVSPADLQALITATNEVEANNDTLRVEYIDTINDLVTPAPLDSDSSWNDILLEIPNLITADALKMSVGTIKTSAAATSNFTSANGGTASAYALSIDIAGDLGFSEIQTLIATRVGNVATITWNKENLYSVSETNFANCVASNTGYRASVSSGGILTIPASTASVNYNIIAIGKE